LFLLRKHDQTIANSDSLIGDSFRAAGIVTANNFDSEQYPCQREGLLDLIEYNCGNLRRLMPPASP
jgi:hypothetical protein